MADKTIIINLETKVDASGLKKLSSEADKASDSLKNVGDEQKELGDESKDAGNKLEQLGESGSAAAEQMGGKFAVIPGFIGKLKGAWKSFTVSFIASGIGALIVGIGVALMVVVEIFDELSGLLDPFKDIFAGITNGARELINQLANIGKLFMQLGKADFSGMAVTFNEISTSMTDAYEQGEQFNKNIRETILLQQQLTAENMKLESEMQKLQNTMDDETKTWAERNAAAEEFTKLDMKKTLNENMIAESEYQKVIMQNVNNTNKLDAEKIKNMKSIGELQTYLKDKHISETSDEYIAITESYLESYEAGLKIDAKKTDNQKLLAKQNKEHHSAIVEAAEQAEQGINNTLEKTFSETEVLTVENLKKRKAAVELFEKDAKALNDKVLKGELAAAGDNELLKEKARNKHGSKLVEIERTKSEKIKEINADERAKYYEGLQTSVELLQKVSETELAITEETTAAEIEARMLRYQTIHDIQKESLDSQLKAGEISQAKYAVAIGEIDNELKENKFQLNEDVENAEQRATTTKIERAAWEADVLNRITAETTTQEIQAIKTKYNELQKLEKDEAKRKLEDGEITQAEYNLMIEQLAQEHKDRLKEIDDEHNEVVLESTQEVESEKLEIIKASLNTLAMATAMLTEVMRTEQEKELKDAGDNEEEKELINKKYFEKQKKLRIAQIQIDAAMGIISSWATLMANPGGTAGIVLAAITTAMIAGMAIYQIQAVAKSKYAKGGKLKGPLHASGGLNIGGVEAEGDEWVLNRNASRMYDTELAVMNAQGNMSSASARPDGIIDYDRLASSMQAKKTYVVSSEITDTQDKDTRVSDRVTF